MATKDSVLRGPKDVLSKTRNLARTMTTAVQVATLPKGSRLLGFLLNGVASDAGTTATVSIGSTSASNQYVNGADIKTAAAGVGPTLLAGVSGAYAATPTTADMPIFFKYAESGGASTVGAWKITILFTAGNITNDDTI